MIDTLSQITFVLVTVAFLALGIRNFVWSRAREQDRFRKVVSRGHASHVMMSGTLIMSFGVLIMFAARSVPNSLACMVLGLAVEFLGFIVVLVAKFGSIETPSIDQMPSETVLLKRVNLRRLSGALFVFGGLVWAWNGAALVGQQ